MHKPDSAETASRSISITNYCRVQHTIFHRVALLSWNYDLKYVFVKNLVIGERRLLKCSWQGKVEITQGTKS